MKSSIFIGCFTAMVFVLGVSSGQTLYIPGGTAGLGSSSNGNVGIGSSDPAARLAISSNNANPTLLSFDSYAPSGGYYVNFADVSLGGQGFGAAFLRWTRDNNLGRTFSIFTSDSSGVSAERMTVASNGNVVIGPSSPTAKLVVATNIANSTLLSLDGFGGAGGYYVNFADVSIGGQGFGSAFLRWTRDNNLGRTLSVFTSDSSGASGERMTIASNGNVGIGSANPTQKLSVNGSIRAKEVIVDTGWADYVFADDYKLKPLSEVEQQIKAEKHLPGIPSAADVAEKGVSMGEMQAKLLAKIEELTLHIIEQEKRIERLENENRAAKERLP
jgi:N6-adenosine-specific RNA methylase IME4